MSHATVPGMTDRTFRRLRGALGRPTAPLLIRGRTQERPLSLTKAGLACRPTTGLPDCSSGRPDWRLGNASRQIFLCCHWRASPGAFVDPQSWKPRQAFEQGTFPAPQTRGPSWQAVP